MAHLVLTRNADGTISVRLGRAVEHIDAKHKTDLEVYEAILWAAITLGAPISKDIIWAYVIHKR